MIFFICFLLVYGVGLLMVVWIARIREKEQENQMMRSYIDSFHTFYGVLQQNMEEVRKYRHDLANHIQTLELMLQEERKEVIDCVTEEAQETCAQKKIPFTCQIEAADYGDISEADMVKLLTNLLDNGIEANERIPLGEKRGMLLAMERRNDRIWIRQENQICPGDPVTFETSKENKKEHGIGIQIIDSVIQKYQGEKESHIDLEKSRYSVDITLHVCG